MASAYGAVHCPFDCGGGEASMRPAGHTPGGGIPPLLEPRTAEGYRELVPLIFELGGRPADETVAFVRSWGAEMDDAERNRVIRYAWQQYSSVLQSGNAEMILSAIGA